MKLMKRLFFTKPLLLAVILGGVVGTYFNYTDYYHSTLVYDVNNCNDFKGVLFDTKSYNKKRSACHKNRALTIADGTSCMETPDVVGCLATVSVFSGVYQCNKLQEEDLKKCNISLVKNGGDALKNLVGLDSYVQEKVKVLLNGEKFLTGKALILDATTVEISGQKYLRCTVKENPPLKVPTGIGETSYIYLKGCVAQGENITIYYTKYNLAGITYPEGI